MTARFIPVEPFDIVVFGGTGDLAKRQSSPGSITATVTGSFRPRPASSARRAPHSPARHMSARSRRRSNSSWAASSTRRSCAGSSSASTMPNSAPGHAAGRSSPSTSARRRTASASAIWQPRPQSFGPICHDLAKAGLITPLTRVVLEKPIGRDLASAQEINDEVGKVFRRGPDLPHRSLSRQGDGAEPHGAAVRQRPVRAVVERGAIDHVQITVAEDLGVGARGSYYDKSGALRDMVQNHMLQLLCLVAMEPPRDYDADAVRDEKLKVLRALKPIGAAQVAAMTVRGQYRAGAIDGKAVPGYLEELGTAQAAPRPSSPSRRRSTTGAGPACRSICAPASAWRRARPKSSSSCAPSRTRSSTDAPARSRPNRLVLRLQPDEGVKL